MDNTLVLIDANSLINRAYFALPPLTNKQGQPSGAVYGFAAMLIKLLTDYKPAYVAAAFDLKGPTFRHCMYEGYKAGRKPMPDDLAKQLPMLKEMLAAMNVAVLQCQSYEADDIIGTVAKGTDVFTYILTADRDSFQLIDERINVLVTKKGLSEIAVLDQAALMEGYCLKPSQIVDYKAIAGDASDCIPGVRGIGEKGATALLNQYGSLDNIYANLENIGGAVKQKLTDGRESAYLSQRLAQIDVNVPVEYRLDDFKISFPFSRDVFNFFVQNDFKSLFKRRDIFCFDAPPVQAAQEHTDAEQPVIELQSAILTGENTLTDISTRRSLAVYADNEYLHFAFDGSSEYKVALQADFLNAGVTIGHAVSVLSPLLQNPDIEKTVWDAKAVFRLIKPVKLINFFDVKLSGYLTEQQQVPQNAAQLFGFCETQRALLKDYGMERLFYDIEQPLENVLFDMEERGFMLDLKILAKLKERFAARMNETAARIYALCGKEFNLNSPKQLAQMLFVDLKIPYPGKPPYSTKSEILEKLAPDYEAAALVTSYRFDAKILSTYLEGLKAAARADGTVHTQFNQMLTTTGRLSSAEPNLQNIPLRTPEGRELRAIFTAREGYVLVSADYSQIELKLLAHLSNDEKLIEAFINGEDIHTATAAQVFGVPKQAVTPQMRREAKAVNFGIIYGISNYGLSQNINIAPRLAKQYIEKYFERYDKVKSWLDDQVGLAKKRGYAITLFNRRRTIPELTSANFGLRSFGERAAMNMPLQGTAADIIKAAMIEADRALKKNTDSHLILQVHDELIAEAKIDEVETVKQILKQSMENAVQLSVPLTIDICCGKTWLDCE